MSLHHQPMKTKCSHMGSAQRRMRGIDGGMGEGMERRGTAVILFGGKFVVMEISNLAHVCILTCIHYHIHKNA